MDRLLSLFSVYDFFGYVLTGLALLAGGYWAFESLPDEPGAVAAFGIIALSYAAGHVVQSAATIWEGQLWTRRGKPSSVRMSEPAAEQDGSPTKEPKHKPFDPALRRLIMSRVERITDTTGLSIDAMFAVARAELRSRQLDGRAELMNAMYGMCRGLATSTALLIPIFIAAGFHTSNWGRLSIAIALTLIASILYFRRAARYSYRFADQVWQDFASLKEERRSRPSASS